MDFKQELLSRAMRLLQNPTVSKALQDPRVMRGLMDVMQTGMRAKQSWNTSLQGLLHRMNLASESELKALRQQVRDLEARLEAHQEQRPEPRPRSDSSHRVAT